MYYVDDEWKTIRQPNHYGDKKKRDQPFHRNDRTLS